MNGFVGRMNEVVGAARKKGAHIIHAPSTTMEFYADHPARRRAEATPRVTPPPDLEHEDPPLPVDHSDRGWDSEGTPGYTGRTRQHPVLEIADEDYISDDGVEVYSILQHEGIEQILIMGVHTGICVLNRSFAIKQMVKWGVNIALVRDLTDMLYNPARPPYVSHEEGTQLVIGYIEKFWCPTVASPDVAR
ncbi:MAG: isochorismatase family protein [Armatimonadetes bacterium]|nr:isochorismatase family protein [Armatimonadota bacterium]